MPSRYSACNLQQQCTNLMETYQGSKFKYLFLNLIRNYFRRKLTHNLLLSILAKFLSSFRPRYKLEWHLEKIKLQWTIRVKDMFFFAKKILGELCFREVCNNDSNYFFWPKQLVFQKLDANLNPLVLKLTKVLIIIDSLSFHFRVVVRVIFLENENFLEFCLFCAIFGCLWNYFTFHLLITHIIWCKNDFLPKIYIFLGFEEISKNVANYGQRLK